MCGRCASRALLCVTHPVRLCIPRSQSVTSLCRIEHFGASKMGGRIPELRVQQHCADNKTACARASADPGAVCFHGCRDEQTHQVGANDIVSDLIVHCA